MEGLILLLNYLLGLKEISLFLKPIMASLSIFRYVLFLLPVFKKTNSPFVMQYVLKCEIRRSMLNKDLQKVIEFFVESDRKDSELLTTNLNPISFSITPESLQNVRDVSTSLFFRLFLTYLYTMLHFQKRKVPRFEVIGKLDQTVCKVTEPFTGELVVESCDVPIKSVDLQLVRVETCGCAEGYARDGKR